MKWNSPPVRMSVGLVLLTVSIVLGGDLLGLVPNLTRTKAEARKTLCESLSVQFSLAAGRNDHRTVRQTMETVVERNEDVISAAMRLADGTVLAEAGDHETSWKEAPEDKSTPTHAQVPIFREAERWGTVEISFRPLFPHGVVGFLQRPLVRMLAFLGVACFFAYLLFIRKTLRHLDPSAVVPSRVKYALDVLSEGVLLVDEKDRIVLSNDTFARNIGREPSSLVGQSASQLEWLTPAGSESKRRFPWLEAIRKGRSCKGVPLALRGSGEDDSARTFMVNGSPILDAGGKARGALATFDDVSEIEKKNRELAHMVTLLKRSGDEIARKNRELEATNEIIEAKVRERTEELRLSKEAAEAANRAKSTFLANISHELRTPMHAILSFSEFGVKKIERASKEKIETYFRSINESGSGLMTLLDDLLDLSKLQAGKMTYEMERSDLGAVISTVVQEFSPLLEKKAQRSVVQLADIDSVAEFDAQRITQVLRNLLSNAIKFSGDGDSVTVTLSEEELDEGGQSVRALAVSVADEGIGVPEDELETIFEPFSQSGRTATGAGGTGLGLPICREIVEAHRGWIRAFRRQERGSTFTFVIPLEQTRATEGVSA